jgi:predicted phosphodiesterase
MRVILFSDIHGNSLALDAVVSDAKKFGQIDAYWVLGDVVGIGPDPVGVLDRLYKLPNASFVRGNTDRYVLQGVRPKPSRRETASQPELRKQIKQIASSFSWTQGAVTAAGWLPWLSKFPLEQRMVLPDGTRVLGVHASPGSDSGPGMHPYLTDAALRTLLIDCEADLIFAGHTHFPWETTLDDIHVVNLGCVSNPIPPDLRACYVVLEADETGYHVQHHRVEYNREAVIAAIQRVHHPAAEYIIRTMQGQHKPAWLR